MSMIRYKYHVQHYDMGKKAWLIGRKFTRRREALKYMEEVRRLNPPRFFRVIKVIKTLY